MRGRMYFPAMINPASTTWNSATATTCKFNLADAAVGTYDVTVSNPGGYSTTLTGGFSVTVASPCGLGGGLGILMLGISLGLLSRAGSKKAGQVPAFSASLHYFKKTCTPLRLPFL